MTLTRAFDASLVATNNVLGSPMTFSFPNMPELTITAVPDYQQADEFETLIPASAFPTVPTTRGKVVLNGNRYFIVDIEQQKAGGATFAYKLYCNPITNLTILTEILDTDRQGTGVYFPRTIEGEVLSGDRNRFFENGVSLQSGGTQFRVDRADVREGEYVQIEGIVDQNFHVIGVEPASPYFTHDLLSTNQAQGVLLRGVFDTILSSTGEEITSSTGQLLGAGRLEE